MNKNRITRRMIVYEIRNMLGNPFIYIFGLGLPIFLSIMMSKVVTQGITNQDVITQIVTMVFLGIGMIVPMACILIGYAAVYSQEIEKGIPLRMRLFGFSEKWILFNRIIAELIFLTAAVGIYFLCGFIFLDIKKPSLSGFFVYFLCLYGFAVILFMIAHALSGIIKKFGPTYAATMILYFVFMIFGGLMGMSYEAMSGPMQAVARLLPITYVSRDFYSVWSGDAYNYVPMLQSYLFWGASAGILLFICAYRERRQLN